MYSCAPLVLKQIIWDTVNLSKSSLHCVEPVQLVTFKQFSLKFQETISVQKFACQNLCWLL